MTTVKQLCIAAILFGTSAFADPLRLSEPVEQGPGFEVFGAPMADKTNGLSLKEVVADWETYDGKPVRITTRVSKVCQKKGCFFIAADGETLARVSFANYAFFIPTDSHAKQATLEGVFKRHLLSPEKARHYAQDLGDASPNTVQSQPEYSLVATSVLLKTDAHP